MAYSDHFLHADEVVTNLNTIIFPNNDIDALVKTKYIGFVSVVAVTVYEMAVKDIFIEFARKKHKVLESFTAAYFDRISGRINLKTITDDYISKFGDRYKIRFGQKIEKRKETYLKQNRRDIKVSYQNIITWRNAFVHGGSSNLPTSTDIIQDYEAGKEVIHILAASMTR
ncbi:MAG: hypothetical protein G3I11_02850 [Ferrovum sp.]|nr:hypothetical protein [Ferrovum sp.]